MKMFQSVRSRSRQRIRKTICGLHLDVHARRAAAVDARYHEVVVAHGEQAQRLDLEVLPLERPVEQRVDEALAAPVRPRAGQLGDLRDLHLGVGVLEEPVDVGAAICIEQLAQKACELGRDAVLDRRVPRVVHVKVPQNLPDGLESVLHQLVGPNRSVRIARGSIPRSSSRSLTVSTNPFDPQTNASCAPFGRLAQHVCVHVAGVAAPALGRLARVGEHGVVAQLVRVDHVVGVAHRVHEAHVEFRHRAPLVPQHRHQRRHSRSRRPRAARATPRATRSRT